MSISMMRARERIQEMKEDGIEIDRLGFVATVLRDNELDEDIHDFYQLVIDLVDQIEQVEKDKEKAVIKAEKAEKAKERAKERRQEKARLKAEEKDSQ